MKHNLFSRFISVLLAVVMLAGLMSMPSLAEAVTGVQSGDAASASSQIDTQSAEGDVDNLEEDNTEPQEPDAGSEGTVDEDSNVDIDTQDPATENTQGEGDSESTAGTYAGMTAAELTDAIMACQSVDEAEAIVARLTEDEMSAYLAEIGSEKEEELESHIADLYNAEEPEEPAEEPAEDSSESESDEYEEHVPEIVPAPVSPVPFTNAVPMFESASSETVTGSSKKSYTNYARLAAPMSLFAFDDGAGYAGGTGNGEGTEDVEGLNLEKSVTANGDGTYTIDLSVWTEGTVTTSQTTKPVDIVLVLDQSGSMEYEFDSVVYEKFVGQTAADIYSNNRNNTYVQLSDGSYSKVTVNRERGESNDTYTGVTDSRNRSLYQNRDNLYYLENGQYHKVTVDLDLELSGITYTYKANGQTWTSSGRNTHPDFASNFYIRQTTYSYIYTFTYTDENGSDQTVTMNPEDVAQTDFGASQQGKELYYTGVGGTEHRLDALMTAVDQFVDSVAEKAKGADGIANTPDDVHHRISIVGYSSSGYRNTELLTGVNVYEQDPVNNAQTRYYPDEMGHNGPQYYGQDEGGYWDGYVPKQVTADDYRNSLIDVSTDGGVRNAKAAVQYLTAEGGTQTDVGMQMANNVFANNPVNANDRDRVIILFTDGIPTGSGSNYSSTVANLAIEYANTAKNTYGAKVYAIGIFDGADPTSYGNTWGSDSEKGNYFMQNVSSNNGIPQNPSYYLAASNSTELNQIFNAISQTTGSSSVNLDTETVVTDAVTKYFQIVQPEGTGLADSIDVSVQKYDGEGFTTTYDNAPESVQVTVTQDNKVQVTGYDFAKKFISKNGRDEQDPNKTGEYYGERLCISFNIEPKAEFWGGNEVPTNITDESGVIDDGGMLEKFPVPDPVDVPLHEITLEPKDLNIYYGNTAPSAEQLVESVTVPDNWTTDYVNKNITFNTTSTISNTEDGTYSVTATLSPKYEGKYGPETTDSVEAKVNVFKPIVTWKDTTLEANAAVNGTFPDNKVSVVWKHDGTAADNMVGTEPTLTFAFELNDGSDIPTNITTELLVKVKNVTSSNEANLNVDPAVISYEWVKNDSSDGCTDACVNPKDEGYQFRVHVGSCELVITKTITGLDNLPTEKLNDYKNGLTFTYTNKADSTDTGSIKLAQMVYNEETHQYTHTFDGLKVGATYTISEAGYTVQDYDFTGTTEKEITTTAGENQVAFDNEYTWNPKGKLTVSKTLNNFNSTMGKDAIFQFEVTAGNDSAYAGQVWHVNITFNAKGTATADLTGLPVGTYIVKELDSAGYTLVGDSDPQTITINPDGTSSGVASFTNDKAGDNTPGDQDIVRNNFTYDSTAGVWKFTQEHN